jgi:site-specific recombinase XerD
MSLTDFLQTIYIPLRLRGRSQNSVRLLAHAIRQYSKFLRRDAVLEDFDDLTVSQFLSHRGATLSPYSVERERSGLLALWRLAADRRLVDLRPCVQAELLPERIPRAFTVAELERLYAAAEDTPGWIGPVAAGAFWTAAIMALYESGERIEAMLNAPKSGYTAPFLRVPASIRKGKRTPRIYEFSADTCRLVEIAAKHDAATLFLWPMDPSGIYNHFHKITHRAGLGSGRDVMFHCIRRTTASHLAAATGSVDAATAYLGHSSDRITRRSYIDPRIVGAAGVKPLDALPRIRPPAGPKIHRIA